VHARAADSASEMGAGAAGTRGTDGRGPVIPRAGAHPEPVGRERYREGEEHLMCWSNTELTFWSNAELV